jgi:hypothetical protein
MKKIKYLIFTNNQDFFFLFEKRSNNHKKVAKSLLVLLGFTKLESSLKFLKYPKPMVLGI